MHKILIIAGSDSGAGAGIQADLKSAAVNGVYASTAITSITAQNTLGVQAVYNLPDDIIYQQIQSVMTDIGAEIVKTGMLSTVSIINTVAKAINELAPKIKLICDPVMVAKGGHKLLDDDAVTALKVKMISRAYLVTPNIPEAEVLSGVAIKNEDDIVAAGKKIISETGCNAVLVKGGHMESDVLTDVLIEGGNITKFASQRINTKNTHGTGCSYASAIAANLAKGQGLEHAVQNAHGYIHNAIKNAVSIGKGHSPVNHFCN